MQRTLFFLLIISLAGNAVMLLLWPGQTDVPSRAASRTAPVVQSPATADSRALQLLQLEQQFLEPLVADADRYWLTDAERTTQHVQTLLAARQSIRDALVRLYGRDAEADPLFGRLFRPLGQGFEFLTSAEQIAIERLQLERDERLRHAQQGRAGMAPILTAPAMAPDAAVVEASDIYQRALVDLLDADTLFEFQLRDSFVAQQLRASAVRFSEPEFRQAFAVLQELQDAGGDIDRVLRARQSLRDVLGSQRFAAFWAARDPMFAVLQSVTERLALPEPALLSVYEVISDFQDRRMRAAAAAGPDASRPFSEAAALQEQERQTVARIVGEDAATELMRALAIGAVSFSGGAGAAGSRLSQQQWSAQQ